VLHLYGRPVSDQDARNLVATLIEDGTPDAISAARQIGYALQLDRVMVGLTPAMRDAILSVIENSSAGLGDLRGALARDHAFRHSAGNRDSRGGTVDSEPFRLILIDENCRRTSLVIDLDSAPQVGDPVELPHGASVIVHHVTTSQRNGLAGVIIAGPA
jgi:hypothetical protein